VNVVDAGVVVDLLVGRLDVPQLGDEELGGPHLLDSEVTSALRRLVIGGRLTEAQGHAAMVLFLDLEFARFPADWLRPRMWDLRHNVSAYDATYVALAELLGAAAFLTTDTRLANVPGIRCPVQVV
jgi:predicted nucleic acid-binding protein